ncbi:zinc ribbon domain-containing protein [Paenibacillus psychroresistens]|uniref:zinc ribbon domain-containing protein n=1 Tax=Paenibacillus psychroresistens TaxID=1778678 RepID=UPI00386D343D
MEQIIANRFICAKCKHNECHVKEVAMSGTGLSKLFDIEYNHFLFVSCLNCGFVEVYNPDILHGKKTGSLGTALDLLFGN